ncbi:MAG: glycosyltransferase family 2 protein [Pseudomonadota bacterium]
MIGVVIVSYTSADVIRTCLQSLIDTGDPALRIMVCDNQSPDDTVETVRAWASAAGVGLVERTPDDPPEPAQVTLLHTGGNLGYAGGVNMGLRVLRAQADVDLFWVLNPDCIVPQDTPAAIRQGAEANPYFGLMGGRIISEEKPHVIQSDGGQLRCWTGICYNFNSGLDSAAARPSEQHKLDFISGAHLMISRTFLETVGPMREDYFLYYEEVDWAMRRGAMTLAFAPEAVVHHHGGTAIGSGTVTRRASAFANYFNYRNRMRFMRRFHPWRWPVAYGFSLAKVAKLLLGGHLEEAGGAIRGLNGMAPPHAVLQRISPKARSHAFGKARDHNPRWENICSAPSEER